MQLSELATAVTAALGDGDIPIKVSVGTSLPYPVVTAAVVDGEFLLTSTTIETSAVGAAARFLYSLNPIDGQDFDDLSELEQANFMTMATSTLLRKREAEEQSLLADQMKAQAVATLGELPL